MTANDSVEWLCRLGLILYEDREDHAQGEAHRRQRGNERRQRHRDERFDVGEVQRREVLQSTPGRKCARFNALCRLWCTKRACTVTLNPATSASSSSAAAGGQTPHDRIQLARTAGSGSQNGRTSAQEVTARP